MALNLALITKAEKGIGWNDHTFYSQKDMIETLLASETLT